MAPTIPTHDASPAAVRVLDSQIRELYGRCCYSHKTHEKAAEFQRQLASHIKILQIVLSALVTAGAFTAIFEKSWAAIVTTVASSVMTAAAAYLKNADPASVAQRHRAAAAELWSVRERYLSLLTEIAAGLIAAEEIIRRRDDLQDRIAAIYKNAPPTDGHAYGEAKKGLRKREELTFSQSEIDSLLPEQLRTSVQYITDQS
jgi:uncharacterized protein YciI